jgi:hypothetical protein
MNLMGEFEFSEGAVDMKNGVIRIDVKVLS